MYHNMSLSLLIYLHLVLRQKLANEAWVAHLESDRSKIIDLFQGQLRSHLTCGNEDCKKVSFVLYTTK